VVEGKKSLNQLIQLAMSVYITRILLTGEKKIRATMTSLLLSKAPPDWGLHPELATMVDTRGTARELALPQTRTLPSLQR
jgi:hypothetical protein